MKPELQDVLRQATHVLSKELNTDNVLHHELYNLLTPDEHTSVYVCLSFRSSYMIIAFNLEYCKIMDIVTRP